MKTCNYCRIQQPYSNFHKSPYADGYKPKCKNCVKNYNKNYYLAKGDAIRDKVKDYRLQNPSIIKERKKEYHRKNAPKIREKVKDWKINNRQRVRANYRLYAQRHPERINSFAARRRKRIAENGVYKILNKELLFIYASNCFYCGSNKKIEMDHVIPVSRGGRHSIGNLVAACKKCNISKSNKLVMEWKIQNGTR
jgi:5-methylcytosine-specific restriction endonuclease McrA